MMSRPQAERLWHEWRGNHHETLCWSEAQAEAACEAWLDGRSDIGPALMPGVTID